MTTEQRTKSHSKDFDPDEGQRVSVRKTDLSLILRDVQDMADASQIDELADLAGQLQGLLDSAKPIGG